MNTMIIIVNCQNFRLPVCIEADCYIILFKQKDDRCIGRGLAGSATTTTVPILLSDIKFLFSLRLLDLSNKNKFVLNMYVNHFNQLLKSNRRVGSVLVCGRSGIEVI